MKNKKLVGSNIIDCRVQTGDCPNNCLGCYYNRMPVAHKEQPVIPTAKEAAGKIVRMNAEHDSNIEREAVVKQALQYDDSFFNTSMLNLNFPRPVVLTVNADESNVYDPLDVSPIEQLNNIMFVRVRVSSLITKCELDRLIGIWTCYYVPVVLTFIRYYQQIIQKEYQDKYEYKKHVLHSCWQLKDSIKKSLINDLRRDYGSFVYKCGEQCKDCRNCESFYYLAKQRMIDNDSWR